MKKKSSKKRSVIPESVLRKNAAVNLEELKKISEFTDVLRRLGCDVDKSFSLQHPFNLPSVGADSSFFPAPFSNVAATVGRFDGEDA